MTAVFVAKCIGCPNEMVNESGSDLLDQVMAAGWELLAISGRWRCPACYHALKAAAGFQGTPAEQFFDKVPTHSRGALPKATAESILPPLTQGELAKGSGPLDWD